MPFRLQEAGQPVLVLPRHYQPVRDFGQARAQSGAAYAAFFHAMLDGGVYLPPSPFEAWFVSAAHDEAGHRQDRRRPARSGAGRGRRAGVAGEAWPRLSRLAERP